MNKLVLMAVWIGIAAALAVAGRGQIFTTHFVDENDNLIVGEEVSEGGKIYEKIFSHHMPMPYAVSSIVQKTTKVNNIYMLIKRHREAVIAWSSIWLIFLGGRFGTSAMGAGLGIELIKYKYLGNLFLAESLVVYPLLYLIGLLGEKKISKWEMAAWGATGMGIGLTLAPIWPILGVAGAIMAVKQRKDLGKIIWAGAGGLAVIVWLSGTVNWQGFWRDAIEINKDYYIPIVREENWLEAGLGAMGTPLRTIFTKEKAETGTMLAIWSAAGIILIGWTWAKKGWKTGVAIILLLAGANARNNRVDKILYDGFHLLPWIAVLMAVCWWAGGELVGKKWASLILGVILIAEMALWGPQLMAKKDWEREYHVYFSPHTALREAVRIMEGESDELLVLNDESLAFWQVKTEPAERFIFFYDWMTLVPKFVEAIDKTMTTNPPELVIMGPREEKWAGGYMEGYEQLRRNGEAGGLYVREERLETLGERQWEELRFFGWEKQ